jgi:Uri superfamily endonuclease
MARQARQALAPRPTPALPVKRKRPGGAVSYQLLIEVARALRCAIGKSGTFHFDAGRYLYTGSAKRHLEARIARHLRSDKRPHWHIDYLLGAPGVRVVQVIRSALAECRLNQQSPGRIAVPGFGATDCRARCGAHLKFQGPLPRGARVPRKVPPRPM